MLCKSNFTCQIYKSWDTFDEYQVWWWIGEQVNRIFGDLVVSHYFHLAETELSGEVLPIKKRILLATSQIPLQ